MFLYNLKLNANRLSEYIFIIILVLILLIFIFGIYEIFIDKNNQSNINETITLTDTIKTNEVFEITPENYSTILQTVNNDINSYIGCKIHFTGYIYRLLDFDDDKFVLARDMYINKSASQSLVIGFLCSYKDAQKFDDYSWVDLTGIIEKGKYYGDVAQINVLQIQKCDEPIEKFVSMPDEKYIPTSEIL